MISLTVTALAQSSAGTAPAAAKKTTTSGYRPLTPKDGLSCGARVASMGFTFFGTPSGELTGFECLDKGGKTSSIELKSKEFSDGKIETKDFGVIIMKQTNGTSATYEMTESQIKQLRTFLGFSVTEAAKPAVPVAASRAAVPSALFDPKTPLVKGQEVRAAGIVKYETPEKDPNLSRPFASLKIANGEFVILMDALGEQMAKAMDGKRTEVKGILTGHFYTDMTSSLSSPSGGTISQVSRRKPELQVEEFK